MKKRERKKISKVVSKSAAIKEIEGPVVTDPVYSNDQVRRHIF